MNNKELHRNRREIVEYQKTNSKNENFISKFYEKIVLWLFERKVKRIKTGSPNWHKIQDKICYNSTDGLGSKKRTIFYFLTLKNCLKKLFVHPEVIMNFPQRISIGENVKLNRGVIITATDEIEIGNDVIIGPYSVINSGNHRFDRIDIPIQEQGHLKKPITIEDDVWIGANTTIVAGVKIGKGCVIGAGAVVTKNISEYSIAVGVPAKVIKSRINEKSNQ